MIQTAQTQTGEAIPEGMRPEEFLRDADLPAFYERELAACPCDTHEQKLLGAQKAALFTQIALLEAK
jgi:hypothetical protein